MKELCRERADLERALLPWGLENDTNEITKDEVIGKKHMGICMKAEKAFAFPQRNFGDESTSSGTLAFQQCSDCDGNSPCVRFHVFFQPRGQMAPSYLYEEELRTKAWDVAFSPALYPRTFRIGVRARDLQLARLEELMLAYGDYYPEEHYHPDGLEVTKILKKLAPGKHKLRKIPQAIINAREGYNTILDELRESLLEINARGGA